jgi:hypothetical protein
MLYVHSAVAVSLERFFLIGRPAVLTGAPTELFLNWSKKVLARCSFFLLNKGRHKLNQRCCNGTDPKLVQVKWNHQNQTFFSCSL